MAISLYHRNFEEGLVEIDSIWTIGDQDYRPGREGGNGPPEGKFKKLGGKLNFGVLRSKTDVIRAKKGAISLFLTNKASFSC